MIGADGSGLWWDMTELFDHAQPDVLCRILSTVGQNVKRDQRASCDG